MNPIGGSSPLLYATRSDSASDVHANYPSWRTLGDASEKIGVSLDDTAIARFASYRDLLRERSIQFNLTAIRDPQDIERRLFLDALAMVPAVDDVSARSGLHSNGPIRLIDIGSGAGLPGLVLKIARPALDVTLVDATAKKVAFLREVIARLGLDAVRAVHGRAEEFGHDPAYRAQFDIATARAVARLPVVLEYVVPLLKIGGTTLLPKGLQIDEELRAGVRAATKLGAELVSAKELSVNSTRLVVAKKTGPTREDFPRRIGIPSRSPLGERS